MLVQNLENVIVEAATELAISGECDVPMDNFWQGVDLVPAGTYANPYYAKNALNGGSINNGVRFALEDNVLHMYKFERYGVAAQVSFRGEMVSSSVLVAIAKEWL